MDRLTQIERDRRPAITNEMIMKLNNLVSSQNDRLRKKGGNPDALGDFG